MCIFFIDYIFLRKCVNDVYMGFNCPNKSISINIINMIKYIYIYIYIYYIYDEQRCVLILYFCYYCTAAITIVALKLGQLLVVIVRCCDCTSISVSSIDEIDG